MATTTALTAVRGDTVPLDLVVTLDGSALSLAGCTLFFTARRYPSTAPLIELETDDGITYTDEAAGRASILISADDTASLPVGVPLSFDVQVKTGAGEIYTVVIGTITFSADVTVRTT